jgi:hypothetical protein
MPQHKLRFLPRYQNPSWLVSSDERTEHRCAFMLVVRGNSEFESKNRRVLTPELMIGISTLSGHKSRRNPAAQQSPAALRCATFGRNHWRPSWRN